MLVMVIFLKPTTEHNLWPVNLSMLFVPSDMQSYVIISFLLFSGMFLPCEELACQSACRLLLVLAFNLCVTLKQAGQTFPMTLIVYFKAWGCKETSYFTVQVSGLHQSCQWSLPHPPSAAENRCQSTHCVWLKACESGTVTRQPALSVAITIQAKRPYAREGQQRWKKPSPQPLKLFLPADGTCDAAAN